MDNGNEFQSLGADDLNALSPSVTLNLTDAGVNNVPMWFLRLYLDGLETVRRSLRYLGAKPCKHLKVNSNILKWIRYLIGNQRRSRSIGVIWQNLGNPVNLSMERARKVGGSQDRAQCFASSHNTDLVWWNRIRVVVRTRNRELDLGRPEN